MQRPKTVLVAWELGAGRGHLEHLRPVVAALLDDGWTVIAAVRDLRGGHAVLGTIDARLRHRRFAIGQAPIFLHRPTPPAARPSSLAEILAHSGFATLSLWQPVIAAWRGLVDAVKPDVILGDFAPSVVAAAGGRMPVVMTGNGWTIPPDASPIPQLPIRPYDERAAKDAEARICDVVKEATGSRPECFARLLRGDTAFVFTSALLDPYRATRREPVVWPPNLTIARPHAKSDAAHSVIYLPRRHPAIENVVAAFGISGERAYAYFGGLQPVTPSNVTADAEPLHLPSLLPNARCVVHHGGLGTAHWCLAHRVPQIILPLDLEKDLIAHAVEASGAGVRLSPASNGAAVASAVDRAKRLRSPGWGAAGFGNAGSADTVTAIVDACRAGVAGHAPVRLG